MPLFNIKNKQLIPIKEKKIDLEKDIQEITGDNLETVFDLKFIAHEFALNGLRIDTLAFDEENKSFVIIEYKKDRSFSIIDQGYAYLALMLNNKADFILEYNEKMNDNLKRDDVDWSQSRVLFISHSFTPHQRNAINFQDLPMELWEIKKYDNNIILYNQLKASEKSDSIKTITKDKTIVSVNKEVKNYTVDALFKDDWNISREWYEKLKTRILELDNRIDEVPTKHYVGYKIGKNVILALNIRKSNIELQLYRVKPTDIKDPEKRVEYMDSSMRYWNKHVSRFYIKNDDDMDYAMFLIKQIYNNYSK